VGTSEIAAAGVNPRRRGHWLTVALRLVKRYSFGFALLLTIILLIVNLILSPNFGWTSQLADFAPMAIAAMASTPAIISGGGGFDLSISPLMILISGVFVVALAPAGLGGAVAVPILLGIGLGVGLLNGLLIILLRIPPVVVTLGMYFILIGVNLDVIPAPQSVTSTWMSHLAGSIGPIPGALVTLAFPLIIWVALGFIPYRRILFAVGSDDAAAYSAGINVSAVRVAAYGLGGLYAGFGGIAVIAVSLSASAGLSATYTLQAIASVALGGTSLWGGRGGLFGSLLGGASIYLLGTLLITFQVTPSWLQVLYGAMLLGAVVLVSVAAEAKA
jgi:ribose transport system permease protein